MENESEEIKGYQIIVIESIAQLTSTSNPYIGSQYLKRYMEDKFDVSQNQWESVIFPIIKQLLENNVIIQVNKSYGFLCKQTKPHEHGKSEHKASKSEHVKSSSSNSKSAKIKQENRKSKQVHTESSKPKPDPPEQKPQRSTKSKEIKVDHKKTLGPDVEITKSGRISYKIRDSSSD